MQEKYHAMYYLFFRACNAPLVSVLFYLQTAGRAEAAWLFLLELSNTF